MNLMKRRSSDGFCFFDDFLEVFLDLPVLAFDFSELEGTLRLRVEYRS